MDGGTGFPSADAQDDFSRARRSQLLADLGRRLRREPDDVALDPGDRSLLLRVGPLRQGGGQALIVDAAVPGVGNVIEQLADELSVTPEGDTEFLYVRLAYTNGR